MTEFLALQESLLGRYSLERELGRGGMGTVWLARDIRLDRLVAIKTLHPEIAAQPDARARFIAEARTAAGLAHPHVVPIFSVDADNDPPLIVMALIDGESLAARFSRRGAMPAAQVERLLREIAWALGYAHASGVTHRDLTLANVLLERDTGRALLADFGLASRSATEADTPVFGTPGYLAPEIIRGEPATPASDLYALGVIGYTLLAGRAPFMAESPGELLARHLVASPPPLAQLASGVSRRLVELIEACLVKDPELRLGSAEELLARLERAPEIVTVAPPLAAWFSRWQRFRPIYAIGAPILGFQSWLLMWGYFSSGRSGLLLAATLSSIASLTALPLLIHFVAETLALRTLRQHGFGIEDIRAAWPHWTSHLQRAYDREGLRPLAGRVIFDLTVVGGVLFVLTWLGSLLAPLFGGFSLIGSTVNALMGLATTVYFGVMVGLGIGFISPGVRVKPTGRLRGILSRIWHSPLAARFSALAGAGQHRRLAASGTLHRPTELVLGLAIDEIWRTMPATLQAEVGDNLPALAETLRHGAEEFRLLAERLRDAEAGLPTGHPDGRGLAAERAGVEAHQRETIATLERLRLQLLRSLAERRVTADLSAHLAHGRELERALVHGLAAQDELSRFLARRSTPPNRPTLSPQPTPSST